MKPKKHPNQKLAVRLSGYAASAGALLTIGTTANGQIMYSGLQNLELNAPDELLELDLNSDMVTDFNFVIHLESDSWTSYYGYYYSNKIFAYGMIYNPRTDSYKNSWITKVSTTILSFSSYYGDTYKLIGDIPDGLELGEIIDSNRQSWSNYSDIGLAGLLGYYGSFNSYGPYGTNSSQIGVGKFLGEEKYLGVRFYIGTEQHYGWIRISLGDQVDPVSVYDWAYEATPDKRILAGDDGVVNLPPHLLITGGNGYTAIQEKTLTILASEEITGLAIEDFVVTNGTASNLTEVTAGLEYTIDVTATTEGKVTVDLPAGAVTDLTAIDNIPSGTSWNYDNTPPFTTFPYQSEYSNSSYEYVYMEFNEPVEGLDISDFDITNGTISEINEYREGIEYEILVITPNEGEIIFELKAGAVEDRAGNPNESASVSWIFDETPPEVTLDAGVTTTPNAVNNVDVTFSEPIQYFDIGYFNTTNGTNTGLETLDEGLHYRLIVTANAPDEFVIVQLPEYSVFDFANNGNASTSVGWAYQPPTDLPVYEEGISIYPNPVNGNLHIELESESMIRILNLNGEVLYMQDHVLNDIIDMSGLTPGVYIIRIESSDKITQHKLIVE